MAAIANWTNLSETTFLLAPTDPHADYRVRIFTPERELPFAGHPTLGSCHAWLATGGAPKQDHIVQECGVGLVRIRRDGKRLAFAAPPLRRTRRRSAGHARPYRAGRCGIEPAAIKASQWVDNGPGWVAVMLATRAESWRSSRDYPALRWTSRWAWSAPWDAGRDGTGAQFEVRAFVATPRRRGPCHRQPERRPGPVADRRWPCAGLATSPAKARRLGRAGRVHVARAGDDIWIGGDTVTCIEGTIHV